MHKAINNIETELKEKLLQTQKMNRMILMEKEAALKLSTGRCPNCYK